MKRTLEKLFILLISMSLPQIAQSETQTFTSSDSKTQLLELYTSEGCSSCPPADNWLRSLKDKRGLWRDFIPMAFHVDYWDYIGWKDRFASPEFSDRQRRYSSQQSLRTVYTPGFVLNGREWRDWFSGGSLSFPASKSMPGKLLVERSGNQLSVNFNTDTVDHKALVLNLVLLGFDIQSEVNRGENSGRTLNHDFIVLTHHSHLIKRSKDKSYKGKYILPRSQHSAGQTALVAWLNSPSDLTPIQATGGYLE